MFLGMRSRGVGPDLQREVLGVNPERVEAHRLEHRVPLQPLESSIDVVAREREEVADMQPLGRRVREHHQRVERAHAGSEVGVVRPPLLPPLLPFPFDGGRIVAGRFLGRCSMSRFCHGS